MRRALALVGLAALCAQWAAAFLPSAVFLPLAAVFICAGIAAARLLRRWHWRRHAAAVCLTAACMLCLRAGYFAFVLEPVRTLAGTSHMITATVRTASPGYTGSTIYATVRLTAMDGRPMPLPISVRMAQLPAMAEGEQFSASVDFSALPRNRYQSWYYAQGVYVGAALAEDATVEFLGPAPTAADAFLRLRARLSRSLQQMLPGDAGGIAAAMILGDESGLSQQDEEVFRRAGLSHVLVVSGLHLSAVSGLGYWAVYRVAGRRAGAAAAIAVTVFLMLLLGCTASVARAGVAMLALYGGMLAGRRSDALTSLGLAALCLCAANPFAAVDIGMLLSFSATLGVLAANAGYRAVCGRWPEGESAARRWVHRFAQAAMVSVCASMATLPVLIAAGTGISLVGLAGNLLCVPVMSLSVFLGLICAVAGMVLPWLEPLARLAGLGCGLSIRWMEAVARWLGSLPGAYVYLWGAYAVGVCLALYALVYLAARWHVRWWMAALGCGAFLALSAAVYTAADAQVLHAYPAGSAENAPIVLAYRDCTAVLFRGSDRGVADVRQVLEERGRSGIDLLVDLRSDGDRSYLAEQLPAGQMASAADYVLNGRFMPAPGLVITLRRQEEGALACVEYGGYRLGVSVGKLMLSEYPAFDVYFGGSGALTGLDTRALVLSRQGRLWTDGIQAEQYPGGVRQVLVRAAAGIRIEEESYDFA